MASELVSSANDVLIHHYVRSKCVLRGMDGLWWLVLISVFSWRSVLLEETGISRGTTALRGKNENWSTRESFKIPKR